MKRTCIIFLLTLFFIQPMPLFAADAALYAKRPPSDAAFFRVVNTSDSLPVEVRLNGQLLAHLRPLTVSHYGFAESGPIHLQINSETLTLPFTHGGTMTLLWDGKHSATITEQPFTSRKKARLKLFNIGYEQLSLKTANGKTVVIDSVAANQYGYRDVNALALPFAVYEKTTKLLTTDKIALHRGKATSIFVIQIANAPVYILAEEQR